MVLAPMQPNLCHVRILVGCMFNNGAMISDLRCHDEIEGILWTAATKLCCSVGTGIEISNHDPLWNYTDELSSHELFLGYLSLSCQKIYMSSLMH